MKFAWTRTAATTVLVAAAFTAACSSSTHTGGTATVPPTPTTADPWAVPAVIDTAYLQRVMDRLDRSLGDAFREMVTAKAVDPKVDQILSALYAGDELTRTEQAFRTAATHLDKYRTVPGNPSTTIQTLLSNNHRCIYFKASRSLAAAFVNTPPARDSIAYVAIQSVPTASTGTTNPTHWVLILDALSPTGTIPGDPCL